jgi:hypothetical protein
MNTAPTTLTPTMIAREISDSVALAFLPSLASLVEAYIATKNANSDAPIQAIRIRFTVGQKLPERRRLWIRPIAGKIRI